MTSHEPGRARPARSRVDRIGNLCLRMLMGLGAVASGLAVSKLHGYVAAGVGITWIWLLMCAFAPEQGDAPARRKPRGFLAILSVGAFGGAVVSTFYLPGRLALGMVIFAFPPLLLLAIVMVHDALTPTHSVGSDLEIIDIRSDEVEEPS